MFRLRVHKLPRTNDQQRYRVIAKNGMFKIGRVSSCQRRFGIEEDIYQVQRKCKELIRDCLYERHGKDWRNFENRKQTLISINSAIKRMR